MTALNKQAYRADGGDIGAGRLKEIADNAYGDEEKRWLAQRVLALLDENLQLQRDKDSLEAVAIAMRDDMREAREKQEELDNALCELLPGTQYMDPPDGGSVTPLEQVRRMVADYRERIAELESRTVSVHWPVPKDSTQGWKVEPEFISKVQDAIGYDEECKCWEGTPSMEIVESVLIAAAGIKLDVRS
ncbi:ead/Ea22-like family protein [Escherichia coli]|uniref:ead/Ea22-like family protein n=1 Tax=Escherichia coli TaxID=562 RepID=UPI000F0AADE4|nr:ead/Ea22-like family protein [Escherichia coli]EEW1734672.1 hypothetical protein [Escherichia coli]MBE9692076.1 hypothetical protein [Escherichia coli]MBE9717659.1 hypothetical protein [Escherichia coli]MWE86620.1 hypothetical protein [Escherichia coli]MWR61807.1 hypothetical protein [Escherichia coli]